jgi:hypothetical protein
MRISHHFDDPLVKALCEAAERNEGDDASVTTRAAEPLTTGGAEAERELEHA